MFQRHMLPPSSGYNSDTENEVSMFLLNTTHLSKYTASQCRSNLCHLRPILCC